LRIKTNSKKIKKGDLFIAVHGYNCDHHAFISEAVANGASYSKPFVPILQQFNSSFSILYIIVEVVVFPSVPVIQIKP